MIAEVLPILFGLLIISSVIASCIVLAAIIAAGLKRDFGVAVRIWPSRFRRGARVYPARAGNGHGHRFERPATNT